MPSACYSSLGSTRSDLRECGRLIAATCLAQPRLHRFVGGGARAATEGGFLPSGVTRGTLRALAPVRQLPHVLGSRLICTFLCTRGASVHVIAIRLK